MPAMVLLMFVAEALCVARAWSSAPSGSVRREPVAIDASGRLVQVHDHEVGKKAVDKKAVDNTKDHHNCVTNSKPTELSTKLCNLLEGSNGEVAGKLERAVKGLSLKPTSPNAPELRVVDKDEAKILSKLKASLWELWFCAKRASPPCDPMTSTEYQIKLAREHALTALQIIHAHPEAGVSGTPAALSTVNNKKDLGAAQQRTETVDTEATPSGLGGLGSSLLQIASDGDEEADADEKEKEIPSSNDTTANVETETGTPSKKASDTFEGLMRGTEDEVADKLKSAIDRLVIEKVQEDEIVRLEEDEQGSLAKYTQALSKLHECATYPDCEKKSNESVTCTNNPGCHPKTGHCNLGSGVDCSVYTKAAKDAVESFNTIQSDSSDAMKAYYNIVLDSVSGEGPPPELKTHMLKKHGQKKYTEEEVLANREKDAETEHNITMTNKSKHNATSNMSAPETPEGEGMMLMIGIGVVCVAVLAMIAFILSMAKEESKDAGAESWGEENWGGDEAWGQY